MNPTISVIIPVFNAEPYLARCLESVIRQSHSELDIIVIDDGSTDGSLSLLHQFEKLDSRVRVLTQANRGVSAARNAGLAVASSDLVTFVDADDWLEPTAYKRLVEVLQRHNLDYITCGYFVDSKDSSQRGPILGQFAGVLDTREGLQAILATQNRFVFTRLFRRELIGSTRFRDNLHWGEDTVFVVEVAKKAATTSVVDQPLYHYWQSPESATRSATNPKRMSGPRMTEVLEELVAQDYPELVDLVRQTRIDIYAILIKDALLDPNPGSAHLLKEHTTAVRKNLRAVLLSRTVSTRSKIKALLLAIAPRTYTKAHHKFRASGAFDGQ